MVIIMKAGSPAPEIERVITRIRTEGFSAHPIRGEERTIIGVVGDDRPLDRRIFEAYEWVERTVPVLQPFKLASRDYHPYTTPVALNGHKMGEQEIHIIAGPCSVEDRGQMLEIAHAVKASGAAGLRGGAFKPRTSPYAFQGLGEQGLRILAEAREQTGLPIVTEVMSPEWVPMVAEYADVLQIGARNMQNYDLLKAVGRTQRSVLLKRGLSATISDLLMSAEYVLSEGNSQVILCERGIRTFETATRNTTDINAIPVLKSLTHLPVVLDPSHSTGKWQYVTAIARAAVAAGADGLIVEVHHNPEKAASDGAQSLTPERFADMVRQVRAIARAVERC